MAEAGGALIGDSPRPKQGPLQLYSSDFVPTELRRPWIMGGYRACPLPLRACLLSAAWPTNETLNIWTHVGASALLSRRALNARGFAGSRQDRASEAVLLYSAHACFVLSAAFHLLNTLSLRTYRILHKADVAGILGLVAACFFVGLQLGFGCAPAWRARYQMAITCGCGACAFAFVRAQSVPRFAAIAMVGLVSSAVLPIAHWAGVLASAEELELFGPRLARFFALLALGVTFWATSFPERSAPGRFDVWGHSHTWWHVCVALAIELYYALLCDYSRWREHINCRAL